ncbi:MAG: hypothetical protein JXE07_05100, partial [Candidatus Aminicenantes bacterium]|nr:hypothetical protein [Candidatus Aminicenantes bacterium]
MSLVLLGEAFAVPAFSVRGEKQRVEESFEDFAAALLGLDDLRSLSRDQVVDRLEKLFTDIARAKKNIPRDTFDLGAIVANVGTDPVALFEWVRDNTFLVPYRGVLRGHQGVLMDRLGNSCDRALLLYALLRDAEKEVRLAHGSLSEGQAEEVLKNARHISKDGALSREGSSNEEAEAFLDDYAAT